MSEIKDKVKEKLMGTKDKVMGAKDRVSSDTTDEQEGGAGIEVGQKDDPLTQYKEKEPMSPAKIKEHEPTAVKRDPSDQKIVEPGQQGGTNSDEAREKARRSGMTKGTAGTDETRSD